MSEKVQHNTDIIIFRHIIDDMNANEDVKQSSLDTIVGTKGITDVNVQVRLV